MGQPCEADWKSKICKEIAKYTEMTLRPGMQTGKQNGLPESFSRKKQNRKVKGKTIRKNSWADHNNRSLAREGNFGYLKWMGTICNRMVPICDL